MASSYYTDNGVITFFVERRVLWMKLLWMEVMMTWDLMTRLRSMKMMTVRLQKWNNMSNA